MRAALIAAGVVLAGCWNFDDALKTCRGDGFPCAATDGTGGGTGGGGVGGGAMGTWQSAYTLFNTPARMRGLRAVSKDEVWFAADEQVIVQYFKGNFTEGYLTAVQPNAIAFDSQGVIFGGVFSPGGVSRLDAGYMYPGGETVAPAVSTSEIIFDLWNAGSKVLAAGDNGAVMESPNWSRFSNSPSALAQANGGWGTAENDFWVTGVDGSNNGLLYHFNGTWQPPLSVPPMLNLWGSSPEDIWGTADGLLIRAHPDGGIDRFDAGSRTGWLDVWGSGPNDIFFTGDDGVIAHFDGTRFTRVGVSTNAITGIDGTGPLDVWAVDNDGGIWHYGP